jgi:putative DNA primase/helicase
MQNFINEFIAAMGNAGCEPNAASDIIASDKWTHYRTATDAAGKKSASYRLKCEGDFAVGQFTNWREGVTHTWTSKTPKEYTAEQKEAWKAKVKAEKEQAEKARHAAQQDAAIKAKGILAQSMPLFDTHPYLDKKGVRGFGLYENGDDLVIPMYDNAGALHGIQTIDTQGNKLFLNGAKKQGCFYPIQAGHSVVIICEGYATAASIAEAFEGQQISILCAFDAGNLLPVAKTIRHDDADYKIIIACDNDAFTIIKDKPYNTGLEKGRQAAAQVGGFAIWPEFADNEQTKYTDFNDLHQSQGLDAVRDRILSVITATGDDMTGEVAAGESLEVKAFESVQAPAVDDFTDTADDISGLNLPFTILGYNQETYYYYPHDKRQIFALSGASHSLNNLLQLASLEEWERELSGGGVKISASQIATHAANALFRIAHKRGVFTEENKVRGCGAWLDSGRRMLHCGDVIYIDGIPTDPKDVISQYVYVAAPKLLKPSNKPLPASEAHKLRTICEMPTWETKLSGSLLAGWLVIAPMCSMLPWRPHIWITGEAEAGKSTILDRIIKPTLGAVALNVDGGTTEPAIRTMMGYDGRPIIYDEAESETMNQRSTMEGVLALARKASSGAVVAKYGQRSFKAQFCACFSAINPGVTAFADESRISMLSLKKNRSANGQKEYEALLNMIADTITPDFQRGLLARTVANMPVLLQNIEVFRKAARTVLNAARIADQLAPMLAGLYLLGSDKVIDIDKAEEWIAAQDWTLNTAIAQEPDSVRLIRHISTSIIRTTQRQGGGMDYSVGQMIDACVNTRDDINRDFAERNLRMYGIIARREGVDISQRNHNLGRLLRNTQWEVNWHRALSDIQGAEQRQKTYFQPGDQQRAVRIPIKYFVEEVEPEQEEINF